MEFRARSALENLVSGGAAIGSTLLGESPTQAVVKGAACTVVVCTRNRPKELNDCLAALSRQEYPNFSVLVVDNAPNEPVPWVSGLWAATYMREPVRGLSRARNSGARACGGDIVAFVDDDSIPEPGWLTALVAEFGDPGVMAVTGKIKYFKNGREGRMYGEEVPTLEGDERIAFDRSTPNWLARACFGGIGRGGNMAFRRRAFELWPGFDERLGRGKPVDGGEEHIAWMSLIERGYKVVYTPAAIVKHPYPETRVQQRARKTSASRTAVAYICFLWTEFPQHRWPIARYFIGSALGIKSVRWRPGGPLHWLFRASNWKPMMSGLLLYARTVRARRGIDTLDLPQRRRLSMGVVPVSRQRLGHLPIERKTQHLR